MKYDKKQAKMDMLKQIMEHMDSMGGKSLGEGLQKVTVAAKDKKGLMEGLNKAQALMSDMPESEDDEEENDDAYESEGESKKEMLKKLFASRE